MTKFLKNQHTHKEPYSWGLFVGTDSENNKKRSILVLNMQ
jgi:predicted RNase H-related nuclease YkuK (DUF458 family)